MSGFVCFAALQKKKKHNYMLKSTHLPEASLFGPSNFSTSLCEQLPTLTLASNYGLFKIPNAIDTTDGDKDDDDSIYLLF